WAVPAVGAPQAPGTLGEGWRSARKPGQSDPLAARAVAWLVGREPTDRPSNADPHRTGGLFPRTQPCGSDLLTAGALAGRLGPGQRLTNEAQLAASAGTVS